MPFKPLDFFPWERLTSSKLDSLAKNYNYLKNRKLKGFLTNRDPITRQIRTNPQFLQNNLVVYGEYRDISPGDSFPEKQGEGPTTESFEKSISFPPNLFAPGFEPVVVSCLGTKPGGLLKASHYTKNISHNGFVVGVLDEDGSNHFLEGMPFFLNFIAIGVNNTQIDSFPPFESISFAASETITSTKLNKLVYNSNNLRASKTIPWLRNVDPSSKNPRSAMKFLKDNIVMYSEYKEFIPGAQVKLTGGGYKVKFDKRINFPTAFFHPGFQTVLVANVGMRTSPDDPLIRVQSILRSVDSAGFTITLIDRDSAKSFAEDTHMFVSYMAIGVKGDGSVI